MISGHKYALLRNQSHINLLAHRKYAFVKKFSDVKEKISRKDEQAAKHRKLIYEQKKSLYSEKEQKFEFENENYEQSFKEFLKDTAFLESKGETSHKHSKDTTAVLLNQTSCVKTIFREFKNFSIYKYTPIDSSSLKHKRIENGEMTVEDGVTTKINPHKYVKAKLDQFLGPNQESRLTHQKTLQFLRGAGQGWDPKGRKLSVEEMEEIRALKKEYDAEVVKGNLSEKEEDAEVPKFDFNAVARKYGISYEAVKRILATKGHYNKSPLELEKRLARDAKKRIEAAQYRVDRVSGRR